MRRDPLHRVRSLLTGVKNVNGKREQGTSAPCTRSLRSAGRRPRLWVAISGVGSAAALLVYLCALSLFPVPGAPAFAQSSGALPGTTDRARW